jgi:hypothetical protein
MQHRESRTMPSIIKTDRGYLSISSGNGTKAWCDEDALSPFGHPQKTLLLPFVPRPSCLIFCVPEIFHDIIRYVSSQTHGLPIKIAAF